MKNIEKCNTFLNHKKKTLSLFLIFLIFPLFLIFYSLFYSFFQTSSYQYMGTFFEKHKEKKSEGITVEIRMVY